MPWEPLPDANKEPTRVHEPLSKLMDRLAGASLTTIEVVMDSWADIVGDAAAAATTPAKIANGVLTVRTSDPIWTTEMRWLEPAIIERVAALSGGTKLRSVKVAVAPKQR